MGISECVLSEIKMLAVKYGISKVLLFGSRTRGDYKERSDIDLAVSGGDIVRFSLAVDEKTSTLLKFDVINLDGQIQQDLLLSIAVEGVVLYEKVR